MVFFTEQVKEVQNRALALFKDAIGADIHVPVVEPRNSLKKQVVFIGENVQTHFHKILAAHDPTLEKEPRFLFRETTPCYIEFEHGRSGIKTNGELVEDLNPEIIRQMDANAPKITVSDPNPLFSDENIVYGMVSGTIQQNQRSNILRAINNADVLVLFSARGIPVDILSLISESDILTRIMLTSSSSGASYTRVPKIIFINANMPSNAVASWEADVRNTWGSMIVDAQNQIADPNNFSSYVKKMRSFEPVFVKQDHEAFSLMRFGKPADPRALPRLLLEDKSLITVSGIPSLMNEILKVVSEQFEENEYVQYIQRLQYVRYAVQNESKRVLSAEVYGLLTQKPVHALYDKQKEKEMFTEIQKLMRAAIPAITPELFDLELSLPRGFAQKGETERLQFARRNFFPPLYEKWNKAVKKNFAATSRKIDELIIEHLKTQLKDKKELSDIAKTHFNTFIKDNIGDYSTKLELAYSERFERSKFGLFYLEQTKNQIHPKFETVLTSNDLNEIKRDTQQELMSEMRNFSATLAKNNFNGYRGDLITFGKDLYILVEDALRFLKKPVHGEKRARLEGKVVLLLHEFSELSTSKFFGANPEGTLKKTIETMIVNDKSKLSTVVRLVEGTAPESILVQVFNMAKEDPPYFPLFDAIAHILFGDGSPVPPPRSKNQKSEKSNQLAIILLRKCLLANKQRDWVKFFGYVMFPAGFKDIIKGLQHEIILPKLLDNFFGVPFSEVVQNGDLAIIKQEKSSSVVRITGSVGEPSAKKVKK